MTTMEEGGHILIVDDTQTSLDYLEDILVDRGYKVTQADNGQDALDIVGQRPPDLILLDISMPGMDGFEVCRRLQARPESRGIPILFISGVAALRERVEGFALGAVDFISKPFQQEELLARVRTHLELKGLRIDLEAQVAARTKELLHSEAKLRSLFAAMSDVIFVLDARGRCLEIAPTRADRLYGPSTDWLGKDLAAFMPTQQAELIRGAVSEAIAAMETVTVDYSRAIENRTFWFSATVSPLSAEAAIVVSRDITDRKRIEESLWEMSFRDQLTGLYNRRGFLSLAEQQMKTAARARNRMPLIFVDVDNMKWINDSLGHEEGDRVLLDTAAVFRQTFRDADIMARIGGDEFAVLATDVTDMAPEVLSERLQRNIEAHNASQGRPYELAMSWGIAVYNPDAPVTLGQLMASADELMYAQKKKHARRR